MLRDAKKIDHLVGEHDNLDLVQEVAVGMLPENNREFPGFQYMEHFVTGK